MTYSHNPFAPPPKANRLYIIIPIYNVAPYLKECLDSIKAQTYKNFKAIMIDDCSSDNSAQIAVQYAQNDARFILLSQPNSGVAMARNAGLDYIFATLKPHERDYIGFVDSDDVVAVDYFANLIYCLESRKTAIAKSYNIYRFNDKSYDKSIFAYRRGKSKGGVTRKGGKIEVWRTLYRASLLKSLRFANARLGEDITFGNIANALSGKVAYTRTARYFYRQRENSLMKHYRYSYDESYANFAYMLEQFAKFDLLKSNKIKIDTIQDMPQGTEDRHFARLQNLVRSYNFDEKILRFNPSLRVILDSKTYAEFRAKIKTPLMKRVRRNFQIDIRPYKIYIKLFGKVLCDKTKR